jgi:nitronate monooxygenase
LEYSMLGLEQILGIKYPIFMAPMFLVSNRAMMECAIDQGIAGCFPSLNFRNKGELESICESLTEYQGTSQGGGKYGVNLIAQKTNPLFLEHLNICVRARVPFYITSLGNPQKVIEAAHSYGAKVFCDVTNITHAKKVAELGCDGFIAVVKGAGGHAGPETASSMITMLKKEFPDIPVITAGGVANGKQVKEMIDLGAAGVSIGTRFIASKEAEVSLDYKNAIVDAKKSDIVSTTKISGTPCNIINTPYAREIGLEQNKLEKFLSNHSRTKKYFKMMVQFRGMRRFKAALRPATYKTLWCAGESVESINNILPCKSIIEELSGEL